MNEASITLTLPALRLLSKSIGKTRDSELRKLERQNVGRMADEARNDLRLLDEIDGECQEAIMNLIGDNK